MSTSYRKTYRVDTTRLKKWDYGWPGSYVITICTKNREPFFGDIINRKFYPSTIGQIAENEWLKTIHIRKDLKLHLGDYIIMPDHFHAILTIDENNCNRESYNGNLPNGTGHIKITSKNLSSIIRGFKGSVTSSAVKINSYFAWQSRFYDRVIRDERELSEISEYIRNNHSNHH